MRNLIFLLTILFLFHFLNNIYWLSKDGSQNLGCESVYQLSRAFEIYSRIKSPSQNYFYLLAGLKDLSWGQEIRQKLFPGVLSTFAVIMGVLAGLLNIPFLQIKLLNPLYLLLIAIFTYLLGKNLSDEKTGLLAAFFVSFFPIIYGMTRKFVPELGLITLVTLAYYTLRKTSYFKNTKYSLILGGVGFLGLIIQPLFIAFICGGMFYYFYKILKLKDKNLIKRILNFLICIIIMAISIIFISDNCAEFTAHLGETLKEISITLTTHSKSFIGNADLGRDELFIFAKATDFCPCTQMTERGINLKCFSFYLFQLIDLISPAFFVLMLISLFLYARDKNCREKVLLLIWILIPYLILTLLPKKWGRFYAPALPAIAIILACGILNIKNNFARKILIFLTIVINLGQFFIYSYKLAPSLPFLSTINEVINAHCPIPTNYQDIARKITEQIENQTNSQNAKTVLIDNIKSANRFSEQWNNDLTYYFHLLLNLFKTINIPIGLNWESAKAWLKKSDYDLLIILTDNIVIAPIDNYIIIKQYTLQPANVLVSIYKKNE